jgi:glycosyltransferase involved in cell wall biosynthesis
MTWICSQIGAREHYAVPRVLHRTGKLERLYTDLWAGTMWQALGSLTGRSVLGNRYHKDLVDVKVTSFDVTTIMDSVFGGDLKKNPYNWFQYVGRDFGERVVESFKRQKNINWKELIFFGYDTGFLEPARWIRERGGKSIVCQMDPSRFEVDLIREESKLWPGFARRAIDVPEAYFMRREAEWAVADLVMVNSDWSKQALIRQGVRDEKIVVVPLAYEAEMARVKGLNMKKEVFTQKQPLRVLFLGQVILRKGIQYLIEAARLLGNESVHFDVVGSIGISQAGVKSAPSNMTFHGPVNRLETDSFYRAADLFVLPTLSDGFALTQLEAMAHGLPVIATPNCGEVVSDGLDGLTVPACDPMALAEAIQFLIQSPEKLWMMSKATKDKVDQFSLERLGTNLASLENRLFTR